VVDEESFKVGQVIEEALAAQVNEVFLMMMKTRIQHGEEPPRMVADAMASSNVVIIPTTKSLTHTEATREACRQGSRIASMPGIDLDMFSRTLNADYKTHTRTEPGVK